MGNFATAQNGKVQMGLGSTIGGWLRSLGHALSSLFTSAVDTETGIFDAYFSISDDVKAMIATFERFRNPDGTYFEFKPAWKTRVIFVPRAWEGFQDLFDIVFHGFHDRFIELRDKIETLLNVIKNDRNHPVGDDGPSSVANVQEKLATIKLATVHLKEAFHVALDIEQMMLDVKQRIETLDDLFLPQGNPKKTVDEHYRKRQRS